MHAVALTTLFFYSFLCSYHIWVPPKRLKMNISTFLPVTVLFLLPYLAESSALSVKTSNGLIVGHRASNRTNVFEYIGIPFAQPPVSSLRFAPPDQYQCPVNSSILLVAKYVSLSILKMLSSRLTNLHNI